MAIKLALIFVLLVGKPSSGNPVGDNKEECNFVIGNHYVPENGCEGWSEKLFSSQRVDVINGIPIEHVKSMLYSLLVSFPINIEQQQVQVSCTACKSGMETLMYYLNEGRSPEDIVESINYLCFTLNLFPAEVCAGLLNKYGTVLTEIVMKSGLQPLEICSFLLSYECGDVTIPKHEWIVELPDVSKPPLQEPKLPSEDAPKLKVLHLSDVHFDAKYKEGVWAECPLPLCCREGNDLPDENAVASGKWGGWKCDTPERTLDHVLEHIAKEHSDIDYIIWTGDLPAHDLWEQEQEDNLNILKATVAKMSSNFPNLPIFPALGNHETVPGNLYVTPAVGGDDAMDWLYKEVSDAWSRWLPGNATATVRKGAFYTTLIRPGLRIISMNMNYCYNMNWWLMMNSTDPVQELQWMIEVLQSAEINHEKVHIIGHVPAGHSDCIKIWQENYYKILNRYEATITAQFFGHTHNDEFEVFYDLEDHNRPIAVGYLGPSITTYTYLNPGYRIYTLDGDYEESTRFILDHETWILDLEKSNKEDNPVWEKLYSAKNAYNMSSLLPSEWDKLYRRLIAEDEAMEMYHRHYWKNSPKRPECDLKCKKKRLCDIRSCVQYEEPEI